MGIVAANAKNSTVLTEAACPNVLRELRVEFVF